MGAVLTATEPHLRSAHPGAPWWRSLSARLLILAVLAAAAARLPAQQDAAPPALPPPASLHGLVTSTDGAVYEGARVQLQIAGAAAPLSTLTDDNGAFTFSNLPPGAFSLTVASPGFTNQSLTGLLRAGQDFDAHTIALPLVGATNEVTVSADSPAEIAQEQLNFEEKQRVLGFFPNYYVSYDRHPEPLSARQKYQLAWKTALDPVTWAMTAAVAGMEQASNTFPGYGQGAVGYGKRFGANYADMFSGTMIGGAVLPALLRQDPRYFYKGTGPIPSRALYAVANVFVCKGDNGRWQPNYSGLLGGVAAGAISEAYYPPTSRTGVEITFSNALVGAAGSAMQNLAQEFIVRRLTPRLPRFPSTTTQ